MLKEVHRRGMSYSAKPSLLAYAAQQTCNELEVRLQACLGAGKPEQLARAAKSLREWGKEHQNFLRAEGIAEPQQVAQIALLALKATERPAITPVDEARPPAVAPSGSVGLGH